MPAALFARRLVVAASLSLLAASCGDPTTSVGPSAALRRAIAPGSITVADLGTPPGENDAVARAANDSGVVLAQGSSGAVFVFENKMWSAVTAFPAPVAPKAINDAGDILAAASNGTGVTYLRRGGVTTVLPVGGDGDYAFANAMNDSGVVVGSYTHGATGVTDAVIWRPGALAPEMLPALPGGDGSPGTQVSAAFGINDAGQVVGESFVNGFRAVLWENGVARDLGTLGGSGASAVAINERGDIVGSSYTAAEQLHPFLWRGGTMTDLRTFGEGLTSVVAINDAGQVIGNAGMLDFGPLRGVVWDDGVLTPLEPLPGYNRSSVVAMTNDGRIIGRSNEPLEPGMSLGRVSVWTVPLPPDEGQPPHGAPHDSTHDSPHGSPHDPRPASHHARPPAHAAATSTHHG